MPMWMAVTSEFPTCPVQGAPLAGLVRVRPKALVMACISSGMGARTTTRRRADGAVMRSRFLGVLGERLHHVGAPGHEVGVVLDGGLPQAHHDQVEGGAEGDRLALEA